MMEEYTVKDVDVHALWVCAIIIAIDIVMGIFFICRYNKQKE
jgi:hypothetical protein